jgi:hypothetical protein
MVSFNPSTSLGSGTQNQFTTSEKRVSQPIQAETPAKKKEGSKNSWLLPTLAITVLAGLVTFFQRKNIGKAWSEYKVKRFKELQETAKKEFGLQSVIFRDSLQTAREVITVLRDLKQRGYDLSDISIIVSEKASKINDRLVFTMKEGNTPEIINENFQANKTCFSADKHNITDTAIQKKLLDTLMLAGYVHPTSVGLKQKPVLILNPSFRKIGLNASSTQNPLHNLYHELGHALHYKELLKKPPLKKEIRAANRDSKIQEHLTNLAKKTVFSNYSEAEEAKLRELSLKEVSSYSTSHPFEFIPEYFVKKLLDPSYRNETLDKLYSLLKGPEILPKPQKPSTP